MGEFTRLLEDAKAGDQGAIDAIFELTYRELHALAHARLQRGGKITVLDTTSLVHECYLRLTRAGKLEVRDRPHFMCYAARAMRSISVDCARRRNAERRGGHKRQVTLDTDIASAASGNEDEIVRVDEALQELAQLDARLVEVVELKYFAGLSTEDIAKVRGVTPRTVRRDWEKARAFLFSTLQQ
jgi:RNA polymerase sigma factor (TIGR02999 family)